MDLAELTRDLEALRDEALAAVAAAQEVAALEAIELDVLGKKGRLTAVLRGIGGKIAEVGRPIRCIEEANIQRVE